MDTLLKETVDATVNSRYPGMAPEGRKLIEDILIRKELEKGELLFKEGQVCHHMVFVGKGMMRQFYYKNGKDVTEHFSYEGCIIICISSIWTARTMVSDAHKKVYVLDGNVPILVHRSTMDETLDMEAKSHVEMFHHYFFTLPPDDKYIRYTMEKAMYLVDETGLAQYNTLKEKGFYSNILGTSSVFSIYCDSVAFNKEKMEFTYYGRQRIERRSNILMRELVTAGQLKRVPRTENNPHGLLIVNWRTLLNKDIEQKTKINY